jgi:hypothetical protein
VPARNISAAKPQPELVRSPAALAEQGCPDPAVRRRFPGVVSLGGEAPVGVARSPGLGRDGSPGACRAESHRQRRPDTRESAR